MDSVLISETTFEKARAEIKKHKDKRIIFSSNDDELARKILEKENINVLLINQSHRKDWQKQRNSGLDSVMAKEAKKKGAVIGINLDEILESRGKARAEILARIKQNIKLCNKNKLKMVFLGKNKRDSYDLKSLGLSLGMSTEMIGFI